MDFLIDFYRSSPDWVKAVWVLSVPAFVVAMTGLTLWYRVAMRRLEPPRPVEPPEPVLPAEPVAVSS